MTCVFDNYVSGGAEQYDVLWLHNEKEIKPSKDFEYKSSGQTHSLVIQEIFPEDAGSYTCEAFNDVGECFSTCSLVVEVPGEEVDMSLFNKSAYFTNLKCMNPYLTAAHIVISTIMISVPTWERISLSNIVESFATTCSLAMCTICLTCSPRCTRPSSPPSPPR